MLALAELARNWGDWQWWPFWLVDFVAAAGLVVGGLATLRRHARGVVWLAGAWGFACAMFTLSFWSHVESLDEPVRGNLAHGPLTTVIGGMWLVTLAGLALSLRSRPDPGA